MGLLAMAVAGCSEGPPAEAAALAPGTGVLRGLIVDAAVRPLANVTVTATAPGGQPHAATTDADGLFQFSDLAPGSYAVEARKATYLSAHALAQVVAGDAEPALVQLVLAVLTEDLPFAVAIVWEGFIGCAFSYGNLCSAPAQGGYDVLGDQSAHLFWNEYVDAGRVPDLVQAEAVWEATLPTSAELRPIFGWSTPDEWVAFQYGGVFDSFSTPSPIFYRLSRDDAAEVGLGVQVGLVVEYYTGAPGGLPAGLTINQPIRMVLHNFYGYLPAEEWRFVADGPPPGP